LNQKSKVPDYPTEWVPGKFNDEKADITSFPERVPFISETSNKAREEPIVIRYTNPQGGRNVKVFQTGSISAVQQALGGIRNLSRTS